MARLHDDAARSGEGPCTARRGRDHLGRLSRSVDSLGRLLDELASGAERGVVHGLRRVRRIVLRLAPTRRDRIASLLSFGEELGWRGYMTTRLVQAKVPAPLVVGAIIWGAYHVPLILWGDYSTSSLPALSAALFMVCVVFVGLFFAWLRLA